MRALLEGQRQASMGIVAGLAGVICLLIASVGLNVKHSSDLRDLKHVIYKRCQQRQAYDQANHASIEADAELYRQLLDIADRAPRQTDPRLEVLVAEQRRVIAQAADRKAAAVRAGVIGSCNAYR
jgi:hypothetical protein